MFVLEAGNVHGSHGYNNSLRLMSPIFIGHGPAFKKGFLSKPFRNIDIYPLACHILELTPSPNNGSLENVEALLRYPPSTSIDNVAIIGKKYHVSVIFLNLHNSSYY